MAVSFSVLELTLVLLLLVNKKYLALALEMSILKSSLIKESIGHVQGSFGLAGGFIPGAYEVSIVLSMFEHVLLVCGLFIYFTYVINFFPKDRNVFVKLLGRFELILFDYEGLFDKSFLVCRNLVAELSHLNLVK